MHVVSQTTHLLLRSGSPRGYPAYWLWNSLLCYVMLQPVSAFCYRYPCPPRSNSLTGLQQPGYSQILRFKSSLQRNMDNDQGAQQGVIVTTCTGLREHKMDKFSPKLNKGVSFHVITFCAITHYEIPELCMFVGFCDSRAANIQSENFTQPACYQNLPLYLYGRPQKRFFFNVH